MGMISTLDSQPDSPNLREGTSFSLVLRKFNDRTEGFPVFRLVYGDFDFSLVLPFEAHVEERLYRIISLADGAEMEPSELARRTADTLSAAIDAQLLPPTIAQIKYAVAIAQELALELPAGALRYRESMKLFLDTHAPLFRESKAYRRSGSSAE